MNNYRNIKGVLPDANIKNLIAFGFVNRASAKNVGSSSLDLSLSSEVYMVHAMPMPMKDQTVRSLIQGVSGAAHSIANPLEVGITYMIRLTEKLELPEEIYAYSNPKSTTGRDDVYVRVLADGVPAYDTIPSGYRGELWLEVRSHSFRCLASEGLTLNQIRFFASDTRIRSKENILAMEQETGPIIWDRDGNPIALGDVADRDGSILLTADLESEIIGYMARSTHHVLDMSSVKTLDPDEFFIPIRKPVDGRLYLEKGKFYILSNNERVRVPSGYACEMRAMDDRLGEVRVHYAGYIDDGWGDPSGSTLTLEVRPHENMYLQVGQPIARIIYEKMARVADKPYTQKTSNYVGQSGAKLAKHFKSPR